MGIPLCLKCKLMNHASHKSTTNRKTKTNKTVPSHLISLIMFSDIKSLFSRCAIKCADYCTKKLYKIVIYKSIYKWYKSTVAITLNEGVKNTF